MRMQRRNSFRCGPIGITSAMNFATASAPSKRRESLAAFASCSAVSTMPGTMAGMRRGSGFSTRAGTANSRGIMQNAADRKSTAVRCPLLAGDWAVRTFRAKSTRCFDQLLDRRLIFAGGLQHVNADGAADRNERVGRIGVKLLEAGDQLEAGHLAGGGALALGARGQAGAGRVRAGGDVDLVQRVEVPLRVADGPEQLLGAAQTQELFAIRGRRDLARR